MWEFMLTVLVGSVIASAVVGGWIIRGVREGNHRQRHNHR